MPIPYLSVISFAVASAAVLVDVHADDVRAFLDQTMRGFLADAAAGTDDDDDLPREFLLRGHALQLRLFEQPVLDVESFLLRQRDVFIDRFRAAHHFDGAVVELGRHARFRLVLAPRDHAEARDQDDRRVRVAHRRRVRVFAASRNRPRSPCGMLDAVGEFCFQARPTSSVCGFQST